MVEMNDNELSKVPTLDRYEADLEDWELQLNQIRELIDYSERTKEAGFFVGARKKIQLILEEIERSKHFIAVKRAALADVTPGVETLFENGQEVNELQQDPRLE
jgi:hypothetical protein